MSAMSTVTVSHNFETGHRLPILQGKCQNLHGHSWWVHVTVSVEEGPSTVVEFGLFKKHLREWIDTHLDHGLMLGAEDPLADLLPAYGKVFVFDPSDPAESLTHGLAWPTVENVARLLSRVGDRALHKITRAPGAHVSHVEVSETHVNKAGWSA